VVPLGQGWATLFDSWATLETKLVDAGQYKYYKDLFDMIFEKKWAYCSPFYQNKHLKRHFLMFYQYKKMFAGHIKVLGGPHVARGPDVAQACPRSYQGDREEGLGGPRRSKNLVKHPFKPLLNRFRGPPTVL